ncbi:hypothetical protein GOB57_24820 [Sinorhizobium meliloti]|nr:hypothetical protein [Sinorhizobium meliloti]
MRKLAFVLGLICATPAMADGFQIDVENFIAERGISQAVMKITNKTGKDVRQVFIDCVFLDKDQKAIDIGKTLIGFIANDASVYDKAAIATTDGVQFVQCNVRSYN